MYSGPADAHRLGTVPPAKGLHMHSAHSTATMTAHPSNRRRSFPASAARAEEAPAALAQAVIDVTRL